MATDFDLYRVTGTAGNVGTPGAPILYFDLLVHANSGAVSGQARIIQAIQGPAGNIQITNITGLARKLIFGGTLSLSVTLNGTYDVSGPPDEPIIFVEKFEAHFVVDQQWDGRGGFSYRNGATMINDVPVTSTKESSSPIHTLYGPVIHGAAATGDLVRMKEIAAKAEQYIAQTPDIQSALTALKAEIAKASG
jgi:hypothetical protein